MSNVNLDFHRGYTPPAGTAVNLNFTLNPDGVATVGQLVMVKVAPSLQMIGDAQPATPVAGQLVMTKAAPTLHISANYDNAVFRGPSSTRGAAYEQAAPVAKSSGSLFEQAASLHPVRGASYDEAVPLRSSRGAGFKQASNIRVTDRVSFEQAAHARASRSGAWGYPPHVKVSSGDRFERAVPQRRSVRDGWEYPAHVKVSKGSRYQEAVLLARSTGLPAKQGTPTNHSTRMPWQEATGRIHWGVDPKPPEPPKPPFAGTGLLKFICPWLDYAGNDIRLNFAVNPCPPDEPEPPGETVIVPVKKVYIVLNSVMLRRVDGNVELPTFSLSMTIDADSWTWGFNASLPAETLDAVQAGSDGTPVELEAVINGTAYRVLAEKISRERTFGRAAIRVSGNGKSAILGAPYAPVQNFSNSAARTAQQLMNDALTLNGTSIGWTVNWAATDWLVPSGAWSHQGSYITALNAIAGAAGAYIQPHPNQKALNVLARYPTAPWNWGSVTPDFELPAAVTMRESIEWLQRPAYNRVFVSGEGQGVLGQVTRTGTAGDILAPMVTDALITHADAARQRGLAILGDTGRQAHVSLRLPVLPETGIIMPGKFVRYVDGDVSRIGLVRSTSADGNMPEVWQTIGVETHVA
ncbi:hypothetical protein LMG31506_00244 [Cupriavidus yeoncheonensis]|uniref:Uncharacterized protein n=1 Tax=Cupriavidus yeoncheonensis TaxID=1462994 RepID=A0A916IQU6_9BURK|nr:hypothetical protein [Cupriavidus yeoncheonensis]CAG2126931.1 hypothetical protein LMG31506_00244 [Cupriavidus yeoncheonensis]